MMDDRYILSVHYHYSFTKFDLLSIKDFRKAQTVIKNSKDKPIKIQLCDHLGYDRQGNSLVGDIVATIPIEGI